MIKKGRYGQYIKGIFTAIDFAIINAIYLLVCYFTDVPKEFFCKNIWLMFNLSYAFSIYFFADVHQRRIVYADRVVLYALKTVSISCVSFVTLLSIFEFSENPYEVYLKLYSIILISLSIWWITSRKILRLYRALGFNYRKIIVIGSGSTGEALLKELSADAGYGYKIMRVFEDNNDTLSANYTIDEIQEYANENQIDEMYCTVRGNNGDLMKQLINIADGNSIDFYYVPQISQSLSRKYELHSIGNLPALSLRRNPLNNALNKSIKRIGDVIFSAVVLILSPIVLIPVAIAIKISSPGPIFFKQKRTGYRGTEFMCYKFRTMRVNNNSDTLQAEKNDPRKTKVGEFLRKTSIDELPQFFNVLKGDMSVVGPRPHMVKHTQDYSALISKYMVRHIIKPGITGWAQVCGYRGQTEELWQMEKRVEHDVWYTENWNFMLDVKIIFLTIINAIRGEKNAF